MKRFWACFVTAALGVLVVPGERPVVAAEKTFRAGAAKVDVSPKAFPVIVNGGFLEQKTETVRDPLFARALVLDDGTRRLAIVVVDSCMVPRELIDRAKQRAKEQTGIPEDRMLVSSTHTHTAPACMGALGARADADYVKRLPDGIAEAIVKANGNLSPAQLGWTVVNDDAHTHCRSWIRRPDRMLTDPFGDRTVRANMHPGYQSPDVIGPAGPVDPAIAILVCRTPEGRPLALLANYSMHYFGTTPVSADYFGLFAKRVEEELGARDAAHPFVAMMSQGTSGDQHWMDYGRPKDNSTIESYAEAIAREVLDASRTITYQPWLPLTMAETRITLRRRTPDEKRLAWARPIVAAMGDRVPRTLPEVYAKEAIYLHEEPERELKLQAIRIGDLGIAAIPDEVFALSGLKIKAHSPLATTFVMELANGSEGYIPPPEQHVLGGYTSWPARTAALEVQAETKIVETVLGLLEKVAERTRRTPQERNGTYAQAVLASKPLAYWRLAEMSGRTAADASGHGRSAALEGGFALYLEGPASSGFSGEKTQNRAVHLAGGHLATGNLDLGTSSSVEFWFWNGLPHDARAVTGVLLSETAADKPGLQLAIGGKPGRLVLTREPDARGATEIPLKTWHHVAVVREREKVAVYLDGKADLSARIPAGESAGPRALQIGGTKNGTDSLEGRIDEVAVYDRPLSQAEVEAHFRTVEAPVDRAP